MDIFLSAAFAALAVFNDLTASTSKFNFVQHVLSMGAPFSGKAAMSRALPAPDVGLTLCRSAASTSAAQAGCPGS
ncbi:DUF2165 family protein [Pseudomonas libanensis]|uniref:DUF2165 family protein n=1 Tax=Pseudomonas libanensis TaxID=75588 RepID=UPI0009EC7259|nr:DUF2165 family protein [Pseudomonas libanensis]